MESIDLVHELLHVVKREFAGFEETLPVAAVSLVVGELHGLHPRGAATVRQTMFRIDITNQ
jgi:hypothetical protein